MSDSSFSGTDAIDGSLPSSIDGNSVDIRSEHLTIHNCTWDWKSPGTAMFTWIDYAVAVTHLGAVLSHFSRLTAYIGLFVTVRILPGMNVREKTFSALHKYLIQVPIDTCVSWFKPLRWCPRLVEKLSKLSAFLDLPLLFFSFMNNDFYFTSDLVAPNDLDGERYLFSCATAAERFVSAIKARHENKTSAREDRNFSAMSLGGAAYVPLSNELSWALTQPRGNCFVRLAGWAFRKILRISSVDVTIDAQSFSADSNARTVFKLKRAMSAHCSRAKSPIFL